MIELSSRDKKKRENKLKERADERVKEKAIEPTENTKKERKQKQSKLVLNL
jgi:hypothetical protein